METTFRKLLEKEALTPETFKSSVNAMFKKHFPNGFIDTEAKMSQFGQDKFFIRCVFGMIGNLKDNSNGIPENDKMRHSFMMWKRPDGLYSFEGKGRIYVNPPQGSYLAMESVKTKMGNNTKITLEKAEIKMGKFFKKLSGMMKEHQDNIYGVDSIDKKYLTFK